MYIIYMSLPPHKYNIGHCVLLYNIYIYTCMYLSAEVPATQCMLYSIYTMVGYIIIIYIYSCANVVVLGGIVYQEVLCGADRCGHVRGRVGMEMQHVQSTTCWKQEMTSLHIIPFSVLCHEMTSLHIIPFSVLCHEMTSLHFSVLCHAYIKAYLMFTVKGVVVH